MVTQEVQNDQGLSLDSKVSQAEALLLSVTFSKDVFLDTKELVE